MYLRRSNAPFSMSAVGVVENGWTKGWSTFKNLNIKGNRG